MAFTKFPVTIAVITTKCAKPNNRISYILSFCIFYLNNFATSLFLYGPLPSLLVKVSFFLKKRFLIRLSFHWNICHNQRIFKNYPVLKPAIGTSGKTLRCCASGVNDNLILDKMFKCLIDWMVCKIKDNLPPPPFPLSFGILEFWLSRSILIN